MSVPVGASAVGSQDGHSYYKITMVDGIVSYDYSAKELCDYYNENGIIILNADTIMPRYVPCPVGPGPCTKVLVSKIENYDTQGNVTSVTYVYRCNICGGVTSNIIRN